MLKSLVKGWLTVVVVLFCLSLPVIRSSVFASIALPQTGQTSCYDANGAVINCAGTGQDGGRKAGISWPNPRFFAGTGPTAGCVTDNLTGLMWYKPATFGLMTWQNALQTVDTWNTFLFPCNFSNWRLPNIFEHYSLMNAGVPDSIAWLNTQGFTLDPDPAANSYYWSSDTVVGSFPTDLAYATRYSFGDFAGFFKGIDFFKLMFVRNALAGPAALGRTGQTACYDAAGALLLSCTGTGQDGEFQAGVIWPTPRFTNNGNGTVTDNLTDLIWLRDAGCMGLKTWDAALTSVKSLQDGQCNISDGSSAGEWKLPNVRELLSLVDLSIPPPPVQAGTPYWTSTSVARDPGSLAYIVTIDDGTVLTDGKALQNPVLPMLARRILRTSQSAGGLAYPLCSAAGCWYGEGATVKLMAMPASGYTLSFWVGDCAGFSLFQNVTMDTARTCTAAFASCPNSPVKNQTSGNVGPSIQAIYNDSATLTGHTLLLTATDILGNVIFDASLRQNPTPVDITLQGGWNCTDLSRAFEASFINGTVTVISGSVALDGVIIH